MRKDAFRNLMTFSFPQVDTFGAGSLVTRMTNDITQVQNLVSQFVRGMIRTGMLMFGSIFFMFRLNARFGLIVLCAFPLIVGCLAFCLARANPLFTRLQVQVDRINAIMQEDLSGIRMIKACVREIDEKRRFAKANDDLIRTQLKVLTIFVQRIASVRRADRIVVLENGRIAACGTHRELLEGCKTYRDIYDSQMGKEDAHGG